MAEQTFTFEDRQNFTGMDRQAGDEKPSLGVPSVVDGLVRDFMALVCELRGQFLENKITNDQSVQRLKDAGTEMQEVFYGRRPDEYIALPWNSPEQLGRYIINGFERAENCDETSAVFALFGLLFRETMYVVAGYEDDTFTEQQMRDHMDGIAERFTAILLGLPLDDE